MMQSAEERRRIAAMGTVLSPDLLGQVKALYAYEQVRLAADAPAAARDVIYGPHDRHRLDVYRPHEDHGPAPVLVFVHGGGFVRGNKGDAADWGNANVGRMAAAAGFVGIVLNYRLAPDHVWPAGAEDVRRAVAWLHENAAAYGGDPSKIVLSGSSAGAIHVAGALKLCGPEELGVRGAILLSGLYGYTTPDERDIPYYGEPALYPQRMPMQAVVETSLPLYVACAEHDPVRFQQEFIDLMKARWSSHGHMPRGGIYSGHNHFSLAFHLGTSDSRLADEIRAFVEDVTLEL